MGRLQSSEQSLTETDAKQSFCLGKSSNEAAWGNSHALGHFGQRQHDSDRLTVLARILFDQQDMMVWINVEDATGATGVNEPILYAQASFAVAASEKAMHVLPPENMFRASAPLYAFAGHRIGTLHIAALDPWRLAETSFDQDRVEALAGVAADLLEARLLIRRTTEAMAEKDIMTREADHRVANGLQLLHSALLLQAKRDPNAPSNDAIQAAARRVEAVAGAHRHLHTANRRCVDEEGSDAADYLKGLLQRVGQRPGLSGSTAAEADPPLMLDVEPGTAAAVPAGLLPRLGLIAAELVANALKHGVGPVRVELLRPPSVNNCGVVLAVSDDGPGFPPGFAPKAGDGKGLGMRLVAALSRPGSVSIDPKNRRRIVVHLIDRAPTAAAH
jgi:two-component sensor histidine kinase